MSNIHNEHLKLGGDGNLDGLFALDINKFKGGDLWDKIHMVMSEYYILHPNEIRETVSRNTELRNTRANDFASVKGKNNSSMRWLLNIPAALMFKLEEVEPRLFSDKKFLHKFTKKYKGLAICKRM